MTDTDKSDNWNTLSPAEKKLSIFLFIILLFVVVKVFFNRENLSKLHSNIEKSQIDQITQNAVKESVKSAQSILHSTPVTAESPQAPEQALAVVPAPAVAPAPAPAVAPAPASTVAPAPVVVQAPAVAPAPVVVQAPAAEPPQPAPIKKAEPLRKPAKKVEDNLIDLL